MGAPLVSCIVPVHNGQRYVAEALDSIVAQTHRPLEIVVVDDGSNDRTPAILAGYRHPLTVVRQDRMGTVAARNAGLLHASGEYFAFLDADDLWHPCKLALQLRSLLASARAQVGFTFIQNFWSQEVPERMRDPDPALERAAPGYVCPAMLAQRAVFDLVGQFDASVRHTSEMRWILEAAELGVEMTMIHAIAVRRRLHLQNQSRHSRGPAVEEYLQLLKLSVDRRRRGAVYAHDFHAYTRASAKDGSG